jgi:hypothetical protein
MLLGVVWQLFTDVSGQSIGPIFTGQESERKRYKAGNLYRTFPYRICVTGCRLSFFSSRTRPVKMGPILCPETSVNNYHATPRNIPEERRSHQDGGRSLKSALFIVHNNMAAARTFYFGLQFSLTTEPWS